MSTGIQKAHTGELTLKAVEEKIITLRNQLVLLDSDVAALYGVETKRVNEAVRNNPEKFPEGYLLEVDRETLDSLRSKFSTLEPSGRGQYSKYPPKAFTEKGLYMLATILKSDRATATTLAIIEAFAKMRAMTRSIAELMKDHENVQKQREMVLRGDALLGDIIGTALDMAGTETSFELNLGAFKIKHTVKKSKVIR